MNITLKAAAAADLLELLELTHQTSNAGQPMEGGLLDVQPDTVIYSTAHGERWNAPCAVSYVGEISWTLPDFCTRSTYTWSGVRGPR